MSAVGIDNGNSQHERQARADELEALFSIPSPNLVTTDVPVMETVKALADKFFNEQQVGLMILRGGLYRKGERIAMEAEAKLAKLAEYADELAEVMQ
jgi:hypothetical protein